MPRPRLSPEPRVATAVRLPESLHRRLHRAAAERQVSANLLVTTALDDYLDRLPPPVEVLTPRQGTPDTDERRATDARAGGPDDPTATPAEVRP